MSGGVNERYSKIGKKNPDENIEKKEKKRGKKGELFFSLAILASAFSLSLAPSSFSMFFY